MNLLKKKWINWLSKSKVEDVKYNKILPKSKKCIQNDYIINYINDNLTDKILSYEILRIIIKSRQESLYNSYDKENDTEIIDKYDVKFKSTEDNLMKLYHIGSYDIFFNIEDNKIILNQFSDGDYNGNNIKITRYYLTDLQLNELMIKLQDKCREFSDFAETVDMMNTKIKDLHDFIEEKYLKFKFIYNFMMEDYYNINEDLYIHIDPYIKFKFVYNGTNIIFSMINEETKEFILDDDKRHYIANRIRNILASNYTDMYIKFKTLDEIKNFFVNSSLEYHIIIFDFLSNLNEKELLLHDSDLSNHTFYVEDPNHIKYNRFIFPKRIFNAYLNKYDISYLLYYIKYSIDNKIDNFKNLKLKNMKNRIDCNLDIFYDSDKYHKIDEFDNLYFYNNNNKMTINSYNNKIKYSYTLNNVQYCDIIEGLKNNINSYFKEYDKLNNRLKLDIWKDLEYGIQEINEANYYYNDKISKDNIKTIQIRYVYKTILDTYKKYTDKDKLFMNIKLELAKNNITSLDERIYCIIYNNNFDILMRYIKDVVYYSDTEYIINYIKECKFNE